MPRLNLLTPFHHIRHILLLTLLAVGCELVGLFSQ